MLTKVRNKTGNRKQNYLFSVSAQHGPALGRLPWLWEVLREVSLLFCEQRRGTWHLLHGCARCLPMGEEWRIITDHGRSPLLIADSMASSN